MILEAVGLVKTFGDFRALDGLNLEVREGEILGFLGPNGSGKSTTIRVLLGQLRLTKGRAKVFGLDIWSDSIAIHERLAYVPGDVNLWPNLSGGECIDALLGFHGSYSSERRNDLIERFELDPTKRSRTYSKGNRQKVALIAALATDADLYVLDEPTAGLDPLMEAQFQAVIRAAAEEGKTVLLSSHILAEVEALCDRVTIIRRGKTVTSGTLDELRVHTQTTVQVTTTEPINALENIPEVKVISEHRLPGDGIRTTIRTTEQTVPKAVHAALDAGGVSLVVEPPSLDELFLSHYRDGTLDSEDVIHPSHTPTNRD